MITKLAKQLAKKAAMNTSVNFTFDKIKYLEKNRGVSFSDGLERYFKLSGEKKEEFAVYYLLFSELGKEIGHA